MASSILTRLYQAAPYWAQRMMMNAYALRVRRHRYGTPMEDALEQMLRHDHWSELERMDYQMRRLKAVVHRAYASSDYYREVMDSEGVHPEDIRSLSDLTRLPLLTKEIIREQGQRLLTSTASPRGALHGHTSGTTGSPLSLWYDRGTCIVNNAADARQKAWAGMKPSDWIGLLLGRVVVPTSRRHPPFWQVNYVLGQVWFSAFHMDQENLDLYEQEVRRRGLRYLEGYPSTLYILARHLVRSGRTISMEAIFSSSETLHDVQREIIEEAFEAPLYDFYGQAERVIFATECEHHTGKHLAEDYGITEIVDESGRPVPDGEEGYLVGTSLHNEYMPMIRYRMSDVSAIIAEPCPCGRTSRRIRSVTTKAEDIVVTPEGRLVSPSVLTHPFKPFDQLLESQIIQERRDHLTVKLVPSSDFTGEHERQLLKGLRERVGKDVEIDVEVVDRIPREASGKFRWVISKVSPDLQMRWD